MDDNITKFIITEEKSEQHHKNIFDQNNITRITSHECCDVVSSQKSYDDITSQLMKMASSF